MTDESTRTKLARRLAKNFWSVETPDFEEYFESGKDGWLEIVDDWLDELMEPGQAAREAGIIAFMAAVERTAVEKEKDNFIFSQGFLAGRMSHSSREIDAAWCAYLTAIKEGK